MNLKGKTALVTGGGIRVGKAMRLFLEAYICQVRDLEADRLLFTTPPRRTQAEAEADAQEWIGANLASKGGPA